MYSQIQQTLYEMFTDRRYDQITYLPQKHTDFDIMIKAKKNDMHVKAFYTTKKIGKNEMIKFFELSVESEQTHILLISHDDLTSSAKTVLADKQQNGSRIEFFLARQLYFNISKHVFQPTFRLLSEEETDVLLKQLQCKLIQLNKIHRHDPMVRYYDAQPKQVFEIRRNTMRGDRHDIGISYRVVV